MPELPFPDLATRAERATQPPPFEQVVGRARRQRRRRVATVGAVTVTAVGVAAVAALTTMGDRSSAPQPVKPSPTATASPSPEPSGPSAVDIIRTGRLLSYAGGPGASLFTVWQACAASDETDCDNAWQLQTSNGVHQGLVGGDSPSVQVADGAFLVSSWDRRGVLVDDQGSTRTITKVASSTVSTGDVFIGGKSLQVVDPGTGTFWPLGTAPDQGTWTQAAVAADGAMWAMSFRGNNLPIIWGRGGAAGSGWRQHVLASTDAHDSLPGYLAVAGGHVAALSGYDGATVLPVADLAVTADGGRTWTDLHQSDLPFKYVDAMAATSGGTLYVVTPGGEHLYRSSDASWTRFTEVPNPTRADSLVAAGDHVLARGGTVDAPVLVALDDVGHAKPVPITR
jgi:hypothetical protein